jgi:uncharacterized membrane protein YhaH (DUF805 family)
MDHQAERRSMNYSLQWYFFSFKGRIRRLEFWLGYAWIFALVASSRSPFFYVFRAAHGMHTPREAKLAVISYIWIIALISTWPVAAIYAKRLHDVGVSAWWLIAAPLVLLILQSTNSILSFLIPILIPLVIGLLPGTPDANRFGDD